MQSGRGVWPYARRNGLSMDEKGSRGQSDYRCFAPDLIGCGKSFIELWLVEMCLKCLGPSD